MSQRITSSNMDIRMSNLAEIVRMSIPLYVTVSRLYTDVPLL